MASLEPEQELLLDQFCQAARAGAKRRQSFLVVRPDHGCFVRHPGLPGGRLEGVHYPDLEVLGGYRLLHVGGWSRRSMSSFDVTPQGFQHWQKIKEAEGSSIERVAETVRSYLEGAQFTRRFPEASAKWSSAEGRLWSSDAPLGLTTVGHECREAIQLFAKAFAEQAGVDPNLDAAKSVDNIRRSLDVLTARLPSTLEVMLTALLSYWGTLNDLTQRLEHGAQKEGEPIGWEDARAVVFQTGNVMHELARALDRVT